MQKSRKYILWFKIAILVFSVHTFGRKSSCSLFLRRCRSAL